MFYFKTSFIILYAMRKYNIYKINSAMNYLN